MHLLIITITNVAIIMIIYSICQYSCNYDNVWKIITLILTIFTCTNFVEMRDFIHFLHIFLCVLNLDFKGRYGTF